MTRKTDSVAGNFVLGECFCEARCRHGHRTRLFNLGRMHFVACDECQTYMFVGSNLMSSWRGENDDVWIRNWNRVKRYKEIQV